MNKIYQSQETEDINFENIYQTCVENQANIEQLERTQIDNLHIQIYDLSLTYIQSIFHKIYPYKIIKNLKLSFRTNYHIYKQNQYIQVLAQLLFNICQIEHIIINKYKTAITIQNIIPFLKEAQNNLELNQLTICFNFLKEKYEKEINYNLMLFSQELGYLSQIKKLNFSLQNFQLNQQYAQGIFQGFRDYHHIEKLDLKILINDVQIQIFQYIKEQISYLINLKELNFQIQISETNLEQIQKIIQELMISLKLLEVFSINILFKQRNNIAYKQTVLEENLIPQNSIKKLTVNIKNDESIANNISFSNFSNQIFFGLKHLEQISWDLTNCSEINFEHFCQILNNNINLKNLKLKIGNNKNLNSLCLSIQRAQLLENLNIKLKYAISQVDGIQEISQLFKCIKQLKYLKLDLLNVEVNSEILNALAFEIGSCQQLQILIFKFDFNVIKNIDQVKFFKNLQKNQYLNYLQLDFSTYKREKILKIKIQEDFSFYNCNTYNPFRQMEKNKQQLQQFESFEEEVNMNIKKFKRLVKCDCILDRLIEWFECGYDNEQNYIFLDSDEDSYYIDDF
ncbi:hypothetical protein TTHERM_00475380 (macronuclear) [Tetrahymena thermophila SB210]|uniref:Kinase domain protein n=1 Tax=Tetrahymena thermophila (strain SB210) TaxID=312017 RepID=I7M3N1_TETTS|nr:hypothetical protein TTHERM_00475380 [Tetrahymena thermophila SB210]EAS03775.2 hypothetical protein TTHERM_00475380 [Tetrahymena thermophila SB210]|eukprot:XP_001024020.2 hypothetical protein TTHERM_00475380 [Tetrahymena thermophila SB210]